MADAKISALDNLTSADPANDMIPIVDVSATPPASGNTKRISINNLLACSPSATLASATITGALTVGGAANFNGGATAGYLNSSLFFGSSGGFLNLYSAATGFNLKDSTGAYNIINTTNAGVFTFGDGALGTRMTLNSTGLGIGVGAANKLTVRVAPASGGSDGLSVNTGTYEGSIFITGSAYNNYGVGANTAWLYSAANNLAIGPYGSGVVQIVTNGSERVRVDSSGNVGIGVTPSAWRSTQRALQVGAVGSFFSSVTSPGSTCIGRNVYESAAGDFTYIVNDEATFYEQTATGTHAWYIAAAGTGTISFGSAKMTLDASGGLSVGATGGSAYTSKLYLKYTTAVWNVGPLSVTDNFYIASSNTTGVYLTTSGTSWTSNSDERLKDIIEPISNAVAKVGSLRSVIGKFKNDETNTRRSFLIAQDVQAVLPEAVDASNPDRLGVAYSEVIPLLVAAIKELTARVQTIEAK